ncbi:hypothetical protein [Actinacidiphila alni]|uniref:hypothetical protein n=1 Tax=Actinacidiphila alni TaxID=380248 RepID=UPI00345256B3
MTAADVEREATVTGPLLPLVAAMRDTAVSGFVGAGVGTAVVLASPPSKVSDGGEGGLWQTAFLLIFALVLAFAVFRPKTRARERACRESAIPVADPEGLHRNYAARPAARLRQLLLPGAFCAAAVLVAGFGFQSPWLGLAALVFIAVILADGLSLARWQRRNDVVVWRSVAVPASVLSNDRNPYFTTGPRT